MAEYKNYIEWGKSKGVKVLNGQKITANEIRRRLENDELIILSGQINKVLHAILVCGYNNDKFVVCDPLNNHKTLLTEKELIDFSKTDIGQWFLSIHPLLVQKNKILYS